MSSDTLIREVDEELRRDRMRKLWRLFGPWVIVGAVAVVLVVAGYEGWTWWQKTQSAKSSDQFYAATALADGADLAAAKTALDAVIAQGSGGYPMLAQFREAALLAQQGKIDEAVAAYDGLSSSLSNTHLREMALILAGNLLIDKGDVAAVEQRVGGSIQPSSPLRNAAREVLGLAQYKAGKLDDAMKSFSDIINDPLSTQDLRNRVQIYVLQLQAEGTKAIAPPADPTLAPSSEAPVDASSAVSAEASTAVDASTQLDVTPPVVDTTTLSLAAPQDSSAASTAVDASTVLDLTPPVVDTTTLSLAAPEVSSAISDAASSEAPSATASSEAPSSAPASSSAP